MPWLNTNYKDLDTRKYINTNQYFNFKCNNFTIRKTYSYMTVHLYNTYLNCTGWISVEYNPCQRSNLGTGSKIYIQCVLINVNT